MYKEKLRGISHTAELILILFLVCRLFLFFLLLVSLCIEAVGSIEKMCGIKTYSEMSYFKMTVRTIRITCISYQSYELSS